MTRRKIAPWLLMAVASCQTPATEEERERPPAAAAAAQRTVVFLGTSLTAGLGVDEAQAYPAIIQSRIDSLDYDWRVVNAGVSGETSAGGVRRIDWLLRQPIDILVLELGANDGLRGLDVDALEANLDSIIVATRAAYPDAKVLVAGMMAPPNLGARYTSRFERVFRDVASDHGATLIPFLLEGVGGVSELNQADGIHPTAAGHRLIAETVWPYLEPLLALEHDASGAK